MKRTLKALVLGFSLLVASGGIGYAADFQKGVEAFQKGDYATALREWRPLAEQGLAAAQFNLGVMYTGRGIAAMARSTSCSFSNRTAASNASNVRYPPPTIRGDLSFAVIVSLSIQPL